MMTCGARILVVDDHPMLREGLKIQISAQRDLSVCGEAVDVAGALEQIEHLRPDLVIVDIALEDGDGLDIVRAVRARYPAVKTMVLSAFPEAAYADRALRAGALSYLDKHQAPRSIIDAIRTVLRGDRYLTEETTRRLVGQALGDDETSLDPVTRLSDRELEVFRLIGEGLDTGKIATRLHRSVHTIESHRANIKAKLGLADAGGLRRAATQWVLENS